MLVLHLRILRGMMWLHFLFHVRLLRRDDELTVFRTKITLILSEMHDIIENCERCHYRYFHRFVTKRVFYFRYSLDFNNDLLILLTRNILTHPCNNNDTLVLFAQSQTATVPYKLQPVLNARPVLISSSLPHNPLF